MIRSADPMVWVARQGAAAVFAAIGAYVVILAVLRLTLSPYLEIDEAQFVGAVDLRLVYGNSHPPLYNWLTRGALELTGWNWPLSVTLLRITFLGAALALVFDSARRLAGLQAGVAALAAAALCPQVSWMAAHTLAHSLLVMAAAAGVIHGVILARQRFSGGFVLAGAWAGAGLLAKYNILLLLLPFALAAALDPSVRQAARAMPRSLAAGAAVFAGCAAVAVAGLVAAPRASTERLGKLYRDGPFSAIDLPIIGVDGALSLGVSVLAWGGIVIAAIAAFGRPPETAAAEGMARTLRRTVVFGLLGFLVAVLAG
ncbi:MAG: glycosyltransferase family 39 protein, partial [Pseudomonadota bacterium]